MTTRIVDLPDSNSMGNIPVFPPHHQQPQPQQQVQGDGNAYSPINIHPNPFGNAPPADGIRALPPMQQDYHQNIKYAIDSSTDTTKTDNQSLHDMPYQRLPSRDIPQSSCDYTQDAEIQPNYIPKSILKKDYIKEYEETLNQSIESRKKEKYHVRFIDDVFGKIQTPILVAILYFIFQMPILNRILYKFLCSTSLYNSDGNLSWMGIFAKSGVFGIMYFFMYTIIEFASNI